MLLVAREGFSSVDNRDIQDGDTLTVQLFTFDDIDKREGTFEFPKDHTVWERVYMVRTLKCDEKTSLDKYPCGEWDYSTHTKVYINRGKKLITKKGESAKDSLEVFELENYITPYGKRLDLGEDGFTYVYDVTDYAPILTGDVHISSGNRAELLDMKFLFIKGTPPRDIISVENLYPWGSYKYEKLSDNIDLKPLELELNPDAEGYMLRARISGHGHFGPRNCCEWESKTHTYLLGRAPLKGVEYEMLERAFRWNVWKNCGNNPIYPQGGTWQFDRAGWCPGTAVDTYDFELTPKVHPGDTVVLDYHIEPYSENGEKGGSYIQSHQLFTYGPANFKNDASVEDIIAPSDRDLYSRINPICKDPKIVIQNRGSNRLKSVTIRYGLRGVIEDEYLWTGDLEFLEKATVSLSGIPIELALQSREFFAEVVNPNSIEDDYPNNNLLTSTVTLPKLLPSTFTLIVDANGNERAEETSWTITNSVGEVFFEDSELEDDKSYSINIEELPTGCYELKVSDRAEDGMVRHWWNRNSAPERVGVNGRVAIVDEDGELLKELKYDFAEDEVFRFIIK